jgi:hypothetical protein
MKTFLSDAVGCAKIEKILNTPIAEYAFPDEWLCMIFVIH